jgi:hypothetical protein
MTEERKDVVDEILQNITSGSWRYWCQGGKGFRVTDSEEYGVAAW